MKWLIISGRNRKSVRSLQQMIMWFFEIYHSTVCYTLWVVICCVDETPQFRTTIQKVCKKVITRLISHPSIHPTTTCSGQEEIPKPIPGATQGMKLELILGSSKLEFIHRMAHTCTHSHTLYGPHYGLCRDTCYPNFRSLDNRRKLESILIIYSCCIAFSWTVHVGWCLRLHDLDLLLTFIIIFSYALLISLFLLLSRSHIPVWAAEFCIIMFSNYTLLGTGLAAVLLHCPRRQAWQFQDCRIDYTIAENSRLGFKKVKLKKVITSFFLLQYHRNYWTRKVGQYITK